MLLLHSLVVASKSLFGNPRNILLNKNPQTTYTVLSHVFIRTPLCKFHSPDACFVFNGIEVGLIMHIQMFTTCGTLYTTVFQRAHILLHKALV